MLPAAVFYGINCCVALLYWVTLCGIAQKRLNLVTQKKTLIYYWFLNLPDRVISLLINFKFVSIEKSVS